MEEIIGIILNNWAGLKMAIDHGMGGSDNLVAEKITSIIDTILQNVDGSTVSWENISDLLDDLMDVEFNTILEDGSTDEVAQVICELYHLWKNGNHAELSSKMNSMAIKIPLQQVFKVQVSPPKVPDFRADTAGNSYVVQNTDDDGWTEVRNRR